MRKIQSLRKYQVKTILWMLLRITKISLWRSIDNLPNWVMRDFSINLELEELLRIITVTAIMTVAAETKETGIILKPYQSIGSTPPIMEYEYNDTKEIEYFIELANKICVDDLYFLVKSIYKDVVATNEKELIVLLATDTIMSYFQDLFVTTHYLLLTGPPRWGTFLTSQRLRD